MQQIHYNGEPAAAVIPERFWLVASVEALPEDHPTRRWVTALCAYAMRQLVAAALLTEKPDDVAIRSLYLYPPGEGSSADPRVVTFAWRIQYEVITDSDRNRGAQVNERVAAAVLRRLGVADGKQPLGEDLA